MRLRRKGEQHAGSRLGGKGKVEIVHEGNEEEDGQKACFYPNDSLPTIPLAGVHVRKVPLEVGAGAIRP